MEKAREANAALDVAALAIDAVQFAQSKQIARIVCAQFAKLTFTLVNGFFDNAETQLLIGGLQGASSFFGAGGKERVVSATRDLSGLRPKMAVFVAASAFARSVGATSLVAVSNRTHTIAGEAWYQRRKMFADYDAFWIERGGRPTDGGFCIPLGLEPRSNCVKRNMQRQLVASHVSQLFEALNGCPPGRAVTDSKRLMEAD